MRSRNTEDLIEELGNEMANYQRKRYVVMRFVHDEKHIVFNDTGNGRRSKKVFDGVEVIVAMIA